MSGGLEADIESRTDAYFNRTRDVIGRFGDKRVTYAVFLRRPVISAPKLMLDWLAEVAAARGSAFAFDVPHPEGTWVGAGEPIVYVTGSFHALADCETLFLQKLGAACVAAHNAYQMCLALPTVAFLAMEARHCAGAEMQQIMGYAASVGSKAAQREGARGFLGTSATYTAPYFDTARGRGTMPHALIGYAGSTVRAAEMFRETCPDEELTVLTDFFGREVTDGLEVWPAVPGPRDRRAAVGAVGHAWRPISGGVGPAGELCRVGAAGARRDPAVSQRPRAAAPGGHRRVRRRDLAHAGGVGRGGFPRVKIVVSSGFGVAKCRVMADTRAPIDVVGTGSFIPEDWHETYATADIVDYDGEARVKVGREFLLRASQARQARVETPHPLPKSA